jgi:RHS repeat-associated protein
MYGSVRGITNESTVVAKLEYYPYGEVYSMSGGGSAYTFLGKEDPGVGMLDFGPRYYNAMLGRFLSPDPMLAGASAYSYAEGNPVMLKAEPPRGSALLDWTPPCPVT